MTDRKRIAIRILLTLEWVKAHEEPFGDGQGLDLWIEYGQLMDRVWAADDGQLSPASQRVDVWGLDPTFGVEVPGTALLKAERCPLPGMDDKAAESRVSEKGDLSTPV